MADTHGRRACYQQGCRRLECRAANARYSRTHQPSTWVEASTARAHLTHLMKLTPSIGILQCSKLSGISRAKLLRIRNGQQQRITLTTEATVLAIQAIAAPGQTVNGYRTRDYIRRLLKERYRRGQLSAWLGLRGLLRFRRRGVKIRNACRAKALHQFLTAEAAD